MKGKHTHYIYVEMYVEPLTEGSCGVQFSSWQVGSGEVSALVVVVLHIQRAQF